MAKTDANELRDLFRLAQFSDVDRRVYEHCSKLVTAAQAVQDRINNAQRNDQLMHELAKFEPK